MEEHGEGEAPVTSRVGQNGGVILWGESAGYEGSARARTREEGEGEDDGDGDGVSAVASSWGG